MRIDLVDFARDYDRSEAKDLQRIQAICVSDKSRIDKLYFSD